MKIYKAITDNQTFIVLANSPWEAEAKVIARVYPEKLDDDLSDLIEITQIDKAEAVNLEGGDITII